VLHAGVALAQVADFDPEILEPIARSLAMAPVLGA
jgi:hypothetical protein